MIYVGKALDILKLNYKTRSSLICNNNESFTYFSDKISHLIYASYAQFLDKYGQWHMANSFYLKALNSCRDSVFADSIALANFYYYVAQNYKTLCEKEPGNFYFQLGFDFIKDAIKMVPNNGSTKYDYIYKLYMTYLKNSFDENILINNTDFFPQEIVARNRIQYDAFKTEWNKYKDQISPELIDNTYDPDEINKLIKRIDKKINI
jgi:hypothetical protein